jgi:hypothetical protein
MGVTLDEDDCDKEIALPVYLVVDTDPHLKAQKPS